MGSNRDALSSMFLIGQKKYRQHMLELAKHSVSFLFFALDCSTHKLGLVVTRQSRYGDELCRRFCTRGQIR